MASRDGLSSAQRFVTGSEEEARLSDSGFSDLRRGDLIAPTCTASSPRRRSFPNPLMITCRGSRPALVDAPHPSPVRSPSLSAARGLQDPPRFATCPICSAPLEDALAYAR